MMAAANNAPFTPMMNVQPGPVLSACRKREDGMIIIHFEHSTGATGFIVQPEFVENLIAQLQDVIGGIVVAKPRIPGVN